MKGVEGDFLIQVTNSLIRGGVLPVLLLINRDELLGMTKLVIALTIGSHPALVEFSAEHLSCEEGLRELAFFSLEEKASRRPYCCPLVYKKYRERLFTEAWSDKRKSSSFKPKESELKLNVQRIFFLMSKMVMNRSREVVDAPRWKCLKSGKMGL